jgi:hypothetical protein
MQIERRLNYNNEKDLERELFTLKKTNFEAIFIVIYSFGKNWYKQGIISYDSKYKLDANRK